MIKNCNKLTGLIEVFVSRTNDWIPVNLWMSASMNCKFTMLHFNNRKVVCLPYTHTHTHGIDYGSPRILHAQTLWIRLAGSESSTETLFSSWLSNCTCSYFGSDVQPQRSSVSHSSGQRRHWLCLQECFPWIFCSKHKGERKQQDLLSSRSKISSLQLLFTLLRPATHSSLYLICALQV